MVLAHAFGQRYELPIPLVLFVLGGALVVLVSFLLVLPTEVSDAAADESADEVPVGRNQAATGSAGVLLLLALIAAGVFGSQDVPENIVPTAVWLVLWIAVPLSCGLVGDWTRRLNPYATVARLCDSARVRRALLGSSEPLSWPRWLGWWPAVISFFVVACGELVYNLTATLPRVTAYGLLAGALLSAGMGVLFGADAWLGKGEMFSVLFNTWGRLGFFRFGAPGRRGFTGGLVTPFSADPSRLVFVLMLLVSVSFDGLISTPAWKGVRRDFTSWAGGSAVGVDSLTMASFVVLAVGMLMVFMGFAAAVARAGRHSHRATGALAALLPSLLPIAFGYLLAHNLEYLLINGQLLVPLLGNPVGLPGWQWLPAPFNDSYAVHTRLLPSASYWYLAVVVIIAVHVVAVVIAHRHLARSGSTVATARRSEYPWVAAMVAYTMISLWLLAQPLVKEKPAQPAQQTAVRSVSA